MHNGKNALLYTRYFTLLLEDPCSRSQGGVEVAGVDRVDRYKEADGCGNHRPAYGSQSSTCSFLMPFLIILKNANFASNK